MKDDATAAAATTTHHTTPHTHTHTPHTPHTPHTHTTHTHTPRLSADQLSDDRTFDNQVWHHCCSRAGSPRSYSTYGDPYDFCRWRWLKVYSGKMSTTFSLVPRMFSVGDATKQTSTSQQPSTSSSGAGFDRTAACRERSAEVHGCNKDAAVREQLPRQLMKKSKRAACTCTQALAHSEKCFVPASIAPRMLAAGCWMLAGCC